MLSRRSSDDLAKTKQERLASTQVDAFDRKQRLQEDLKDGILKFNLKPKLGLASLHNKGQLDQNDPKAVASFLLQNADRLDKTVVGDYLGKEETYQDGFCVKVLHSYGEQMDFSGGLRCPLYYAVAATRRHTMLRAPLKQGQVIHWAMPAQVRTLHAASHAGGKHPLLNDLFVNRPFQAALAEWLWRWT